MKILVIKLGALGDVLRTTPLVMALKTKFPASDIHWLVDAKCAEVLQDNPLVDSVQIFSNESLKRLSQERYDWAINLDKDSEALDAIAAVSAGKKQGFGRDAGGEVCAMDPLSDYAVRLGVDDDLKFKRNKKSYQEISFEQVGLTFNKEEYIFRVGEESINFAKTHLNRLGASLGKNGRPTIGLNTGAGSRFAGKRLSLQLLLSLVKKFYSEFGAAVLLLGGSDEIDRNRQIETSAESPVINTGSHSIRRFAAVIQACDLVVSGDTTAMHIAIAMKVPVVAYFASTCAQEIELYGRGEKIISRLSCAPCYKRVCPIDEQCMKDMSADAIMEAARQILKLPRLQRSSAK